MMGLGDLGWMGWQEKNSYENDQSVFWTREQWEDNWLVCYRVATMRQPNQLYFDGEASKLLREETKKWKMEMDGRARAK